MKAKDTVMDEGEMLACSLVSKYPLKDIRDVIEETCEHQAEISFPLGKQEGIREVVDFCKKSSISPFQHDYRVVGTIRQEDEHREDCRLCKWQAKLKEWKV